LYLSDKISITPGARYEYINTTAEGFYGETPRNLAGDILEVRRTEEYRNNARHLILGGIGVSYKPTYKINIYTNISQNYRSITFSDMRVLNSSFVIDPNLKDERGYSFDLGLRSERTSFLIYDVSLFFLNYNNRIGEISSRDNSRIIRVRKNIGQATIMGIESYIEADVFRIFFPSKENFSGVIFTNTAFTHSQYVRSELLRVEGNQVEFVPKVNLKTGVRLGYKKIKASFQHTYMSNQFSDATNEIEGGVSAVAGIIPAYSIMDLSLSYEYRRYKIEGSINNLANQMYFTRRATGYPGPGILPSDGRSFYLTLQVKI
ncbi:MAG TPA: TonB-dependent receptor, partial [Cytophagaceae bacterium]